MVTQKLSEYLHYKGISFYAFENSLGVSRGSISKAIKENKSIGSAVLENILIAYPDINPEWLLTGTGCMVKNAPPLKDKEDNDTKEKCTPFLSQKCTPLDEIKQNNDTCSSCKDKERIIEGLERHINDLKELIRAKEQLTGVLFSEIDRLKNMYESNLSKDSIAG